MALSTTTDATFVHDVLTADLPILVEFTASWCAPCRAIEPVLTQIADEQRDRMRVVSLDVDAHQETAIRYQVLGMPTLALFHHGEIVTQFVGARPKSAMMKLIEPYLPSA